MNQTNLVNQKKHRRGFIEMLVKGATTLGLMSFATPAQSAEALDDTKESDPWFNQIKGKHRMVFDAPQPHGIYPFAWPNVFLTTNAKTGTPEKDCSVVVVLRHTAIPFAFDNRVWADYKFGEIFKINDAATNAPSERNPFWQPKQGEYKVPGLGNVEIGINELQARGVLFCVCEMAISANAARQAERFKKDAADIKKDWLSGLLPNIHVVPSGVWALGRAQEHGCAYCFAG